MTPRTGEGSVERLRLLECWLPLAQELSSAHGWGAPAPALEALVVEAAPLLARARGAHHARAILLLSRARRRNEG